MRSWIQLLAAVSLTFGSLGCSDDAPVLNDERIAETNQTLLRGVEQAKFLPNKPFADGYFGWSVALDGDTAAISMRRAKPPDGVFQYTGAVYLYDRFGTNWYDSGSFVPPGTPDGAYGESIDIEGDLLVVGAPFIIPPPGGVFVYLRTAGSWSFETKLIAQDGLGSKSFGTQVALSGTRLAILDLDSGPGGACYIFVRNGGSWSQEARIAWDAEPIGRVALSNDTLVIISSNYTRIFTRAGATWSFHTDLDRDGPAQSVALDGDTLAFAGAKGIRIFNRSGTNWIKTTDVWPAQQMGYGYFGSALALNSNRIVSGDGSVQYNGINNGHVYAFASNAGSWAEEAQIDGKTSVKGSSFGASLALSGDSILIGAPYEDDPISNSGSAYVYTLEPGLENGSVCARAGDCASGFCADGVCCNALCASTCVACSASKKGQGADGICEGIVSGKDPDEECITEDPNTCGTIGECNGLGACAVYPIGSPCDDGNACTSNDTCANGACAGTSLECGLPDACHLPGQCNVSTGECEFPLINPKDTTCSSQTASCGCDLVGSRQTNYLGMLVGLWLVLQKRREFRKRDALISP